MAGPVQPTTPRGGWRPTTTDGRPSRPRSASRPAPGRSPVDARPAAPASTPGGVDPYAATGEAPVVSVPVSSTRTPEPAQQQTPHPRAAIGPLALAVLACVACLPFGVWAVIACRRADAHAASGDVDAATVAVGRSRTVALAGITVGLAVLVTVLAVVAI